MLTLTHVWLCAVVLYTASAQSTVLNLNEGQPCVTPGSRNSICKLKSNCPKAEEDLKKYDKYPVVCNFYAKEPVYCCEPDEPGTKSKQKCQEYAKSVFTYHQNPVGDGYFPFDHCALGVTPLMVGGNDSNPKEFPHMALIGYGSRNLRQFNCGGSLISDRFVLSAAHCSSQNKLPARRVLLGEYNKDSTDDENNGKSNSTLYNIIERISHPEYKNGSVYHDIALFRLDREVEFNEFIRPICLHTDYEVSEPSAIVTGWGQVGLSGPVLPVMQKANLALVAKEQCRRLYRKSTDLLKSGINDEIMFCAGDSKHDTCPGDSGGPLKLRLAEPYCMYTQIGVVSFGEQCTVKAGVYTRVSHYIPWIESIVWP